MRVITQAAAAVLLATQAFGHPSSASTSRRGLQSRAIDLSAFRLKTATTYSNVTATTSETNSLVKPFFRRADYVEAATVLAEKVAPGSEFRVVDDHYVGTNGIAHVNLKQTIHGLDVENGDLNVNVASDGSVFSYGGSFYTGEIPAESPLKKRDQVDPVTAFKDVSEALALPISADAAVAVPEEATEHYTIEGSSGTKSAPKIKLSYLQDGEGKLTLTWRLETELEDNWLLSYANAVSPKEILGVVDYVSDASYTVYPWLTADPTKGSRTVETNPWDTTASELTWQSDGSTTYTTTRGNNGIAQANWEGDDAYINDYRPSATGANFNYALNLATTDPKLYANASVTQLFYTANKYHDLLHTLGFNEAAGNFETNNNGAGGKGSDAVILNAQDGSGTNNANFATPPDGQPGRMRMYLWDYSTPVRDCSFDAGVVIHEYTHGLSNRLTGGPANSACLSVLEAGGMGEGWSDFMAIAIHLKTSDKRTTNYPLGAWVYNNPAGIRAYLYSTSLTTNPYTYKSVNSLTAVHQIGTVWATILYEVVWNLVDKYGITASAKPTFSGGVPTDGRYLAMKLVIDGLALQPCNPTFVSARDGIIDADKALTGGANACALWTAFAKRGLGSGAKRGTGNTGRTESFVIPTGVC
ncbi:extracellular elastinolytic metalloproteinase [Phlyctema vagabunda]|uniref:Extracellular metalloproteinase n=1 Tax=Phlyctema vagabunda TaxID=108571 RepID=A0ABR4P440_9HELO